MAILLTGAAEPDSTDTRRERFTLYIAGNQVGHLLALDRVDAAGRLELVRESDLAVRRGETEIRIRSRGVTHLDRDLAPVGFDFERRDGSGVLQVHGEVVAGALEVRTVAGGAETKRRIPLASGISLAAALEVRCRRQLRDGDSFDGKVVLEELGALVDARYQTRATAAGFVIDSQVAGVAQTETLDPRGRTLRIEIPALGAFAVPEGTAPPRQSASLDVLTKTVWPAPPDMPRPDRLDSATFRIEGALTAPIPEDRRQRVLEHDKRRWLVRVERTPRGRPEALSQQERAEALAETPYEPIHDARIVEAARAATRGAKTAPAKVERLTRFVYDRVEVKDLTRAYAPAPDTLASGVGDCTEHSVLFSALARASGIPTRLVDGVVVAGGKVGYHEWVEVWLAGEGWRPVDPTFGEARAGPNRLKLATGSSQPESLLQMGLAAAAALTGLEIQVVSHEQL